MNRDYLLDIMIKSGPSFELVSAGLHINSLTRNN